MVARLLFRAAGLAANPLKHERWRTEPSATSYEDRTHWSNWLGAGPVSRR
jgi:hypothetical protein